ncbi:hypothetical protein TNCV_3726711 [Trichonephila clavipes]|nr:hypothetical protein TNCV_3726711 [Trichonephila clavipes]
MKAGSTLMTVMVVFWPEGNLGECQQLNYHQPRHTGPTPGVMSGNSTYITAIHEQHSRGSFKQDNAHFYITAVTQLTLHSVDMFPLTWKITRSVSNRAHMRYHWTTTPSSPTACTDRFSFDTT